MPDYGDQHFVPKTYLQPWCDPSTPEGHTPYVWCFPKGGGTPRKKSPKKLFTETDMYTVKGVDGSRDLTLEHGLSELESDFAIIREKLNASEELTLEDRLALCAFVAAMEVRTKATKNHQSTQWGEALEMMKSMREQSRFASAKEREALELLSPPPPDDGRRSMSFEEVEKMVEQPMAEILPAAVRVVTPILMHMNMGIIETDDPQGFITSDDPCVRYDPELVKLPPFYRDVNLMSATVEVTLPISPRMLLLLNRRGFDGRFSAPMNVVDFYNRLTQAYASEVFVTNQNAARSFWIEEASLPDYAWENTRGKAPGHGSSTAE